VKLRDKGGAGRSGAGARRLADLAAWRHVAHQDRPASATTSRQWRARPGPRRAEESSEGRTRP
jgi:hypothetical protein